MSDWQGCLEAKRFVAGKGLNQQGWLVNSRPHGHSRSVAWRLENRWPVQGGASSARRQLQGQQGEDERRVQAGSHLMLH